MYTNFFKFRLIGVIVLCQLVMPPLYCIMRLRRRRIRYYIVSFLKHDFKASINVFLEALPLCIGISLASGVPIYSGFVAGVIGGILVSRLSGSQLCIRGPATGLITACITAIAMLGNIELFFAAVAVAGIMQIILGSFSMGSFTYFIPSVVIKGMMAAIGITLIIQQIPFAIGDVEVDASGKASFFQFIPVKKIVDHTWHVWTHLSAGVTIITLVSAGILYLWDKKLSKKFAFLPTYLIIVITAMLLAFLFKEFIPQLALSQGQFVAIPRNLLTGITMIRIPNIFANFDIWRAALLIFVVSTIESLITIEAIDKQDPFNRITPRSRELVAQGTGNLLSGIMGGLPITALIARSITNLESGARTNLSSFFQGIWLLIGAIVFPFFFHMIPHCALSVIIIRIGFRLANPAIFLSVYRAGKRQFRPFMVTVGSILLTDLLMGILIGISYCFYCLIKSSYHAEYFINQHNEGHIKHYTLRLASNVSFLNKRGIIKFLDEIPTYSIVEIIGTDGCNIDFDILEVLHQYKAKAHNRHIDLKLKHVPQLPTI